MSTGKHTPGPWQSAWDAPDEEVQPGENGEEWAIRAASGEVVVGTMYYDGLHMFATPEDARFIVLACNSHDELVEALRFARQFVVLAAEQGLNGALNTLEFVDAALAKAWGEADA